jgi:hypothetical protein
MKRQNWEKTKKGETWKLSVVQYQKSTIYLIYTFRSPFTVLVIASHRFSTLPQIIDFIKNKGILVVVQKKILVLAALLKNPLCCRELPVQRNGSSIRRPNLFALAFLYWCFHALSLYYTRAIYLFLASRMFL